MPRRLLLLGVALVLAGNADARPATTTGTIVSVGTNGSGLAALSTSPGSDEWPTPSPDGTTVAFVHHEVGFDTVRIVSSNGSDERELGGGRLTSFPYSIYRPPTWSPDGSTLFVSASVDNGGPRYEPIDVFALPVDGGATRDLQSGGTVVFSHDGLFAAFETQQTPLVAPSGDPIHVMHADLTHAVPLGHGTGIAWSPTADRLAFATKSGIGVAAVSGRRTWTLRGPFASTLAWLPNGKSIVYITKGKHPELVRATVDRRSTRLLANLPTPTVGVAPYALSVSPDGRWAAASLETVTLVASTDGTRFQVMPGGDARWAPTGSTLALIGASGLETWTNGVLGRIAGGVDPTGGLAWSPDGTRIYFASA